MHKGIPVNHPAVRATPVRATGFTLIELLVVIAIIGLLLGLVVPSLSGARKLAYKTKTDVRIKALSDGCSLFFEDTGRRYYPGQRYTSALTGTYPGTGSAVLAISLFSNKSDIVFDGTPGNNLFRCASGPNKGNEVARGDLRGFKGYIEYSDEYFKPGDTTDLVLYDAFVGSSAKPICYYPSRLGVLNTAYANVVGGSADGIQQFTKYAFEDNAAHSVPTAEEKGKTIADKAKQFCDLSNTEEPGLIVDPKFPAPNRQPYNADSFLLIAPGIDRAYFTSDDQKNF